MFQKEISENKVLKSSNEYFQFCVPKLDSHPDRFV